MSDCSDLETKSSLSAKRAREASFGEEDHSSMDPKDQLKLITQIQEQPLPYGTSAYLFSKSWFNRWKQYCSRLSSAQQDARKMGEQTAPGPINNNSILTTNGQLAEDLVINDTVYALPEVAWTYFIEWYGVIEGNGEPIIRNVIQDDEVELYPPQFKLYLLDISNSYDNDVQNYTQTPTITLSKNSPVKDFLNSVKDAFDFKPETEIKAWILKHAPTTITASTPIINSTYLLDALVLEIDNENAALSLSGYHSIAIERKDIITQKFPSDDTTVPSTTVTSFISTTRTSNAKSDSSSVSSTTSSGFANGFSKLSTNNNRSFQRGVCGLQNLGNTCFMNSALQCLSNTEQLSKWFLADNYKAELNSDNPLGMKGQVAEAFGELVHKLWSGQSSSMPPRDFKNTIGRFNPSFRGYDQHDTQELLAFLLDGLHEDLNRILKKPYVELPDFDGMKDEEIASCSWDYHKARNDSIIVDLFQGQFKSKLVCEECQNVSVTFDPFMYLSLPLPIKKQSKTKIVYVPYDPSKRLQRVIVTLNKEASIGHLRKEVTKMMNVEDPNSLLVVEIFNHKIYKVFAQYEPVATIGSSDIIYVYELPGPVLRLHDKKPRYSYRFNQQPEDEEPAVVDENQLIVFPVYCATASKNETSSYLSERVASFGDPIILAIAHKDANNPEYLYHLLSQHIERYTQFKLFEEVKDEEDSVHHTTTSTTLNMTEITNNDTPEENADQMALPPSYEDIVEEGEKHDADTDADATITTESNHMELDQTAETDFYSHPIHTAAAVTAAGGKKIEPMANLFAMKVYSAGSYSRSSDEFIPSITSFTGLVDLRERAKNEQKQREEYYRQQNEPSDTEEDTNTINNNNDDTEMEDSIVLPANIEDEEEVEDAAALFDTSDDDKNGSTIQLNDREDLNGEEIANDRDSIDNNSINSVNSDDNLKPALNYSYPAVAIVRPPTLPRRQKVTLPPSAIIRQGESIVLEWSLKKAQQLFGTARDSSSETNVCTEAWEDIEDLSDPKDADSTDNGQPSKQKQKKQVTLADCLDEFTKEEKLSEEDLWYCPKCKKHVHATKKFDLWHMPEIVVVHLKRFSHFGSWGDKIDALIDFPTSAPLDLTDRVLSIEDHANVKEEDRLIYDLYAVDNHYGGLRGGHYTSFAQNFEEQQWYNFDDSHVTKVDDVSSVKTSAAYLLFYKRRRPLNNDPKRSVEEILQNVQEKQQAAEAEEQKKRRIEQEAEKEEEERRRALEEKEATVDTPREFSNGPTVGLNNDVYTDDDGDSLMNEKADSVDDEIL